MVHAAAPCPPEVKRRMIEWWGDAVMEYYAATEGGGTIVTRQGVARAARHRRQGVGGRRDPHLRRRRQRGSAPARSAPSTWRWPRRPSSTRATSRRRRPTASRRRRLEFFTVGDVGELDDDGYLFLRDRKIDMIICGGVNIYPAEIEGEFLTHPKVGDVAVFGIPHADWGEEVKAVVEPAEGVERRRRARGGAAAPSPRSAWPRTSARARSTSPTRCPATPAASSTSASSATPTGKASQRADLTGIASAPGSLRVPARPGSRPSAGSRSPGSGGPLAPAPLPSCREVGYGGGRAPEPVLVVTPTPADTRGGA